MEQKSETKKKLFISGPITGVSDYVETFEDATAFYSNRGYAVLNPADLPAGMRNADYARCCMAMIDSADEVAFLPGWRDSVGSRLEHDYCYYTGKKVRLFSDDRNFQDIYAGWQADCDRAMKLRHWLERRGWTEDAERVGKYLTKIRQWKCDFASVKCLRQEMHINELLKAYEFWKAHRVRSWLIASGRLLDADRVMAYTLKLENVGTDDDQVQVLRDLYSIANLEEEYITEKDRTEELYREATEADTEQDEKSKDDEEVTIKGTIDLTDLSERFFSFGKTGHDVFDDVMDFAVGQALDRGYGVDFSRDADGWRCITLRAPLPNKVFTAKCEEDDTKERGSLWVSVDDKLPKHGEDVLVHYSDSVCGNKMGVGWYGRMGSLSEQWNVFGSAGIPRVTAWTKLPPIPPTVKTEA